MDYRRGRPSDDRRRRVMLDDSRLANGTPAGEEGASDAAREEARAKSTRKSSKSYPDDALASRQMRLTDLLPIHVWVIMAFVALMAIASAGIHVGHLRSEAFIQELGIAGAIFDVNAPGSLGRGLSVLLLAGASGCSFLIYSLRRHKMDDYRGHYGIWLWVALLLNFLTVCEYTGATGIIEALVAKYAPVGLVSQLPLIVHTIVALGSLLFLARLGAEMHQCRAAMVVLALLLGAVGLVVALEAGWRPNSLEMPEELLAFHARLASRGLLFVMLLVYGRYTRLDALGNIKVRERKPRKKSAEKPAATQEKSATVSKSTVEFAKPTAAEPAAEKPIVRSVEKQAPSQKAIVAITSKPALTLGQKPMDEEEDERSGSGRLSRAERRRLKQMGKAA
jgi:hypothetical protein